MTNRSRLLLILLAVLALAVLLLAGRQAASLVPAFTEWVAELGAVGSLVFVAAYILATVLLVPGSVLTLAAGALFGVVRGSIIVLLAATAGACAAFLIARYAARDRVAQHVQRDPRFAAIDRAIGSQGRRIVILLRLSPVFPFNLLNYALGLTSVRFTDYLIACVAMLPGTLLYVYYGRVIGDVAALAAGNQIERGTEYYALLAVGLIATVLVTTVITRTARRELKRAAPDAV